MGLDKAVFSGMKTLVFGDARLVFLNMDSGLCYMKTLDRGHSLTSRCKV